MVNGIGSGASGRDGLASALQRMQKQIAELQNQKPEASAAPQAEAFQSSMAEAVSGLDAQMRATDDLPVEALKGDGPFTVFAPTDDAFAALPEGTVASLLKPENKEKLAAVLTYHVVPGRVFSDAAAKGAKVKTLQGGELTTRGTDDGVFVNGAKVVKADLDCTNGVIHVIDKVLLPQ